ncbi:transposase [Nonomuraea sp. NPDC052265]|uniref:transposase n=1 Tax=Nonomuraea sp. NPDC052265 TaxID=3364374 RepID=UPI0037C85B52
MMIGRASSPALSRRYERVRRAAVAAHGRSGQGRRDPCSAPSDHGLLERQIRAQAISLGASIYFADEAGVRTDFHAGTTWAPVGETPIVRGTGKRLSVNMVSTVNTQGKLHFSIVDGSLNSAAFIDYLNKLLHDVAGAENSSVQVAGVIGDHTIPARRSGPYRKRHDDLSCCCAWPTSLSRTRSRSYGYCR